MGLTDSPASPGRVLFRNGLVADGTGAEPRHADVVVEGATIVDVGSGLDGDVEVDLEGKSILPGLIDCHVHVTISSIDTVDRLQTAFSYPFFQAARHLRILRRIGITHARDAAGADLGIKLALADGLLEGPRLQIAISMLSQTGGHSDGWLASGNCVENRIEHPGRPRGVVDGVEEMRKAVREVVRAGADVIKVAASGGVMSPRDQPHHAHFSPEELAVAVTEARAAGLPVMAHAQGSVGIKNALRAGVRSIEHGIFLDDEAIELLLAHDAFLVPTLLAPRSVLEAAAGGARLTDATLAKAREVADAHLDSFRRACEAGVTIAMGTDAVGLAPGRNLEELDLMKANGLSSAKVLRAATLDAARLLGVADAYGSIEPGKRADLVVVSGDAHDFTSLADRIEAVYMDGTLVESTGAGLHGAA
ncbi:amidohydrolase family protein [Streptomyces sp. NBC_01239]|uniref:metal-dependent hydrolase family protein n=1 Tax=Streptomyces sp. NBC_01239 TaxID=2903792 RepID=UPI00224E05F1|nr:amidohydrolase family protein [Streptomyces sp. NBC_01239]MCX4816072.1 amidohydrolase family protein [Streptomyces sp. NBC_01239]